MNCDNARARLLGCERPDHPGANVERHLSDCSACRAVQGRLLRMERLLKKVPVPAPGPGARAKLLRDLRQAPVRPTVRLLPPPGPGVREGGRRKLAVAFALAAALTVFAIGWYAWPHPPISSPSPELVKYQKRRDLVLQASTSRERVQGLANLAEEVLREAKGPRTDPGHLSDLVRVYGQIVRTDLPEHARSLPAEKIEELADGLRRNESDAARRAAELPRKQADALLAMAEHARFGERSLRALLKAERS